MMTAFIRPSGGEGGQATIRIDEHYNIISYPQSRRCGDDNHLAGEPGGGLKYVRLVQASYISTLSLGLDIMTDDTTIPSDSWTFGIFDGIVNGYRTAPKTWKKREPKWENEQLTGASSSNTFLDVMTKLCNTAIKDRREYDHEVYEHLWKWKIMSMEEAMNSDSRVPNFGNDNGNVGKEEEGGVSKAIIVCPQDEEHSGLEGDDYDSDGPSTKRVSSNNNLSKELLPVGAIVEVTYDYGTTTLLYLKVLSIKEESSPSVLKYIRETKGNSKKRKM